jgi:hypothetical protein
MRRIGIIAVLSLMTLAIAAVAAVGTGFAEAENAAAAAKCSKATLHGTYLFAQDGVVISGKDQGPFAIAGKDMYNGNGKVKAVVSANFNGDVVRQAVFAGTYTLKANCTGTVTYGPKEALDVFVAPDGSMFTFVQIKPSQQVTSGIELRGTAKRVGP